MAKIYRRVLEKNKTKLIGLSVIAVMALMVIGATTDAFNVYKPPQRIGPPTPTMYTMKISFTWGSGINSTMKNAFAFNIYMGLNSNKTFVKSIGVGLNNLPLTEVSTNTLAISKYYTVSTTDGRYNFYPSGAYREFIVSTTTLQFSIAYLTTLGDRTTITPIGIFTIVWVAVPTGVS